MEYSDVKYVVLTDPSLPHSFWVFDKPGEGRMLVNTGAGAAAGQGFANGMTFGLAQAHTEGARFEDAARVWFTRTGRTCNVTSGSFILKPTNYEVFYTCPPAPAATGS